MIESLRQFLDDAPADLLRVRFGQFELDELARELRGPAGPIALEARPFDLFIELLRSGDEVIAKQELIDRVWAGRVVTDGVLARAVMKIRAAIGDDQQQAIKTVHGVGYRWMLPLQALPARGESPQQIDLKPGDSIGGRPHWKLLRVLDGALRRRVWLAAHAKTGEQRVFKFAVDGAGLTTLKREITASRLLAQAPGSQATLVRLLDWNLDQAPFFVESHFFPAGSLDQWCAAQGGLQRIALSQRLQLFVQLVDQVASAHAVGVLHKDIKPGNVLIDLDDNNSPQARLADFGSARVLDDTLLERLRITRMGETLDAVGSGDSGTPLYLAPECLYGHPPTTLSDVYALGVMLYQMAVGDFRRLPAPGWERGIDDILLCEDIAAAIDGDPQFRLSSAAILADRLRKLESRHVERSEHQLQQATAEQSLLAAKNLRRRLLWTSAAALMLALSTGTSMLFHQRASQALQVAEARVADATAVREFVTYDLLRQANPYFSRSQAAGTVAEALEAALPGIGERFAEQPRIAAELYRWSGDVLMDLDRYVAAASALDQALLRYRDIDGELHTRTLWTRYQRARVNSFLGNLDSAAAELRQLKDIVEQLWPGSMMARRFSMRLAELTLRRGDATTALQLIEERVIGALVTAPVPLLEQVRNHRLYLIALTQVGRLDEAATILRWLDSELLPKLESADPEHELMALPRAQLLMKQGDMDRALAQALVGWRGVADRFGVGQRESVAAGLEVVALADAAGQSQQAQEVLQLIRHALDQQHPSDDWRRVAVAEALSQRQRRAALH